MHQYWKNISCDAHWENLVKQSEAFWPTFMEAVNKKVQAGIPAIFEGVNILPHLAKRDLSFSGIYLLGESLDETFRRNKEDPRWGQTEELQRIEAEQFFNCERPKYKAEAERYGYGTYSNPADAEKTLLTILGI